MLYKVQSAKFIIICYCLMYLIASWSKLWACVSLSFGDVGSNPALMSAVCCQEEVSAAGISLVLVVLPSVVRLSVVKLPS